MARALDDLAAFEKYQEEVLPILKNAIKENWSAEKIISHPKVMAIMAAQQVTQAILKGDASARKDSFDRAMGKAKERVEAVHKHEKLEDTQLDAKLQSLLTSASTDKDPEAVH